MAEETRKRVSIEYSVEDHAAGALGNIAREGKHAGKAVEGLKDRVREFRGESVAMAAGVLGMGVGIGALIEKVKDANVEFGAAQKSIAATQATILDWPKSMSALDRYTASASLSKDATNELEEAAGRFNMSLTDVASAYKTIGISAAPLHLSQKQWMDLAIQSAAAAKRFGTDGAQAADTIGKALLGKPVRAAGDLGKYLSEKLLKPLHHMSNPNLLKQLDGALAGSAEIAEKMGDGFGGSVNRIQMRVNALTRDLTGPLFTAVAGALDKVSNKLGEHNEKSKPVIETYATKLVDAFETLQKVAGFISDHWKEIAVVVAGMKFPALLKDMGELGGALTKAVGTLGQGVSGASGLMGMVGAIGPVIAGLSALKLGIDAFTEWLDAKISAGQAHELRAAGSAGSVQSLGRIAAHDLFKAYGADSMTEFQRKTAGKSVEQLRKAGIVTDKGNVSMERFRTDWNLMQWDQKKQIADTFGVKPGPNIDPALEVAKKLAAVLDQFLVPAAGKGTELDPKKLNTAGKNINFTGDNHFEMKFEDTDPDRVMLRFQEGLENQVLRRTSSPLSDPLAD